MDQSKSNNSTMNTVGAPQYPAIPMPKRTITVEFFVGLFTMVGVAAAGYLAIGLGEFSFFGPAKYEVKAEFDNIAGLKTGSSVEIAGVQVGEVKRIELGDPMAVITLSLDEGVKIREDDVAAIRTKGIIGDRYVKIVRGGSKNFIPENGKITQTGSAVDIEDLVGNLAKSFGAGGQEFKLSPQNSYEMKAEFDSIAGLGLGASVEIAGVQVGEVRKIELHDSSAIVTMSLRKDVKIKEDDIAAVRSKGLIGARYVKISRGSSEKTIPENGKMVETESAVDLEDLIGKVMHGMSGGGE